MLFEVVLPLEGLAADLAGEGHVVLVTALVDHQVVGLGKASLAVLADELDGALGSHLLPPAELPAVPLCLHRHYREHPYKFPPLLRWLTILSVYRLKSLPPPAQKSVSLFFLSLSFGTPSLSNSFLAPRTLPQSVLSSLASCHAADWPTGWLLSLESEITLPSSCRLWIVL